MTAILVPWWDTGDPHRAAAFKAVLDHYHHSSWDVLVSSFGRERAVCRNELLYTARLLDAKVVVFNDADTLCPGAQLEQAVQLALEHPGLVYAYDLYVRLTREATVSIEQHPDREWPLKFETQYYLAPSIGCVAIRVEGCPDFDESYRGWGYEDLAWVDQCLELAPARRVQGPAFHLWHGDRDGDRPLDANKVQAKRNEKRWQQTRKAVA